MNKKSVATLESNRAKIKRAEYDDGVIRDNVRIDNKYTRELRVHERAKNVVSRTFDKESKLFKQKQASQKPRQLGLNSQGQKLRLSSTGSNFSQNSPTSLSSNFHNSSGSSPNRTLSPPISDTRSIGSKSPLTPIHQKADNHTFQYSPDIVSPPAQSSGEKSPETENGTESASPEKSKPVAIPDSSRLGVPHRQISRGVTSDSPDYVRISRNKSPSRATYVDPFSGRMREETVFDFLSKPKNNYEMQKRRDIRVQLEREFSTKRAEEPKITSSHASVKKKSVPISPFTKREPAKNKRSAFK